MAEDYRDVWESMLPGMRELHALSETQDWSIESVRVMLDSDLAFVLVDPDHPGAFAVVHVDDSPYRAQQRELFIHLAWHPGSEALRRFQPYLELMARRCGAQSIRFYSGRAGWLRLATGCGYRARSVEYLKEL